MTRASVEPVSPPIPRKAPLRPVERDELPRAPLLFEPPVLPPRGLYPRWGKPLLRALLWVSTLPVALGLGLVIAAVNAWLYKSPRRILFTQRRVGLGGRVFRIYKFRTLRDCEREDFEAWASGVDRVRATAFGRFLRTTHLDELPQLLNIARGEMDFIGPRPEMEAIDRWARGQVPGFEERYSVLPGVTGLAQVTHGYAPRDPEAYARKLAMDRYYIRHLSLGLDLSILARTVVWMVRGRGWGLPAPSGDPRASR